MASGIRKGILTMVAGLVAVLAGCGLDDPSAYGPAGIVAPAVRRPTPLRARDLTETAPAGLFLLNQAVAATDSYPVQIVQAGDVPVTWPQAVQALLNPTVASRTSVSWVVEVNTSSGVHLRNFTQTSIPAGTPVRSMLGTFNNTSLYRMVYDPTQDKNVYDSNQVAFSHAAAAPGGGLMLPTAANPGYVASANTTDDPTKGNPGFQSATFAVVTVSVINFGQYDHGDGGIYKNIFFNYDPNLTYEVDVEGCTGNDGYNGTNQ